MAQGNGKSWYVLRGEDPDNTKAAVKKLAVDTVTKASEGLKVPHDKIVVVGFSQGAIMSYEVALREPELVRGIAALSGSVLPVLRSALKPDAAMGKLAIFIGHGTLDQALPFSSATQANKVLAELGLKPEFHQYLGMNHTISEAEIQDLKAWLEKSLK